MFKIIFKWLFALPFVYGLCGYTVSEQLTAKGEEKVYEFVDNGAIDDNEQSEVCYYLGGILFKDSKNWDIWLNGQVYSKDIEIKYMEILSVSENAIWVRPFSKRQKKKESKKLEVGQTYCPLSHTILSGDHRQ